MKNFIKQNWFKLIITIILLTIAIVVLQCILEQKNELTKNNDFLNQQRCAESASKMFIKEGFNKNSSDYISHWNKSLNKCFINSSDRLVNAHNTDIAENLADAEEGVIYAEIQWTIPNQNKPYYCELYSNGNINDTNSTSCNSKEEFDTFINSFLNN